MPRRSIDEQIGERVQKHRQLASVHVHAAAARCELSPESYLASEQGERRFQANELYDLATYFGVCFSAFITGLTLD